MELATFTLRCDCGRVKEVTVTCDEMVFCNGCDTRLEGRHYVPNTLVKD